jgi:hypothetical protein
MVSGQIEQPTRRHIGKFTRYALMALLIALGTAFIVFGDRWVIFFVDELAKLPGGGWAELLVPPGTVMPFLAAAYVWSLPTRSQRP